MEDYSVYLGPYEREKKSSFLAAAEGFFDKKKTNEKKHQSIGFHLVRMFFFYNFMRKTYYKSCDRKS